MDSFTQMHNACASSTAAFFYPENDPSPYSNISTFAFWHNLTISINRAIYATCCVHKIIEKLYKYFPFPAVRQEKREKSTSVGRGGWWWIPSQGTVIAPLIREVPSSCSCAHNRQLDAVRNRPIEQPMDLAKCHFTSPFHVFLKWRCMASERNKHTSCSQKDWRSSSSTTPS